MRGGSTKDYDSLQRVVGKDHPYTAQSMLFLAILYAAEGKKAEAVTMLAGAVDHGLSSSTDIGLGDEPGLKPLHGDPAFEALVARAREHAKSTASAKPGS